MTMSGTQPSRLVTMPEQECWDHLRSRAVGRIAWSGAEGITVVPVNFAVEDDTVVIRTTPYSLMARECAGRDVGFEVDLIDDVTHTGWSVLVHGRCERQPRTGDLPHPWATGSRVLGLRVKATSVSGRRLVSPGEASS